MKFKLLLLLAIFVAGPASANDCSISTTCKKFDKPLTGGYCIHRSPCSSNRDFLYYLHGRGNSEFTWADDYYYPKQIQNFWKSEKEAFPTVISISFGDTWLLIEKNSSPHSGLLTMVENILIPQIETALGGLKGRRLVLGESMGGINATQLSFKTSLFEKAAILCAPMGTISPHASEKEIKRTTEHSTAWQYHKDTDPEVVTNSVKTLIQLGRAFFPTPEEWAAGDPLKMAASTDVSNLPAIYLAAGFHDRYVVYEGNIEFAKVLKQKGADIEWRPQWGGHCAIDIPTLANFLIK